VGGIDSPGIVFYRMDENDAVKKTSVTEAEQKRSEGRSMEI
jgi:hypothetical protein